MVERKLAGRYDLLRELGRGGRGVVYLAHDGWLDRDVAIKMINAELLSAEEEMLFRREAQVVARLDHPAITPIYDLCSDAGTLFLVMPVISGPTLRQVFEQGRPDLGTLLFIVTQVARALEHSHAARVLHRDIKPENILVQQLNGAVAGVKVLDFGLAIRVDDAHLDSDSLSGTLQYLSPEQIEGQPAAVATDLYALGVVLYEGLAGRRPFEGRSYSLLQKVLTENPLPLRERGLDLPAELEDLVLSCLAKNPRQRPRSASDLADLLERLTPANPSRQRQSLLGPDSKEVRPFADRLGDLLLIQGNYREADELFRRLDSLSPELGITSPFMAGEQARRGAQLALKLGRYPEALNRCRDGISWIGELDTVRAGMLEALAGLVCCAQGDLAPAQTFIAAARDRLELYLARHRGSREANELALAIARTEGNLYFAQGANLEALEAYDRAIELSADLGDRWEHSIALYNAAEVHAALGEIAEAATCIELSKNLKTALADRWGLAYLHHLSGDLLLRRGQAKIAAEEAGRGLGLAQEIGDPKIEARLRILAARAYQAQGDLEAARLELQRACKSAESTGAHPELSRARELLGSTEVSA